MGRANRPFKLQPSDCCYVISFCLPPLRALSREDRRRSFSLKRAGRDCARDSLLEETFMPLGILRQRAFLIVTILCVHTGVISVVAQEPAQTRQGLITTFAPVVEKVAPSVVTVFTTQTVSRGMTTAPFGDD